jgi:hypothetical protein
MDVLHKIFSRMPFFIVINWAFCYLFLVDNNFYAKNFDLINKIDSCLVLLSLIHFFFFDKFYKKSAKFFVLCIFLIIQLTFLQLFINPDIYYFLYFIIISSTIFAYVFA